MKCGLCIWNLLLLSLNMKSKELSQLFVEASHYKAEKSKQTHQRAAESISVVHVIKCTGELRNIRRPRKPWKKTVLDDKQYFFFTIVEQIKNNLQEAEVSVPIQKIQRLIQNKYRGFIRRSKPLVCLKNKKNRISGMLCNGQVNHLT